MKNIKRAQTAAWREIDGAVYAVNTKESMLHELDETGSFIWNNMESSESVDALAEKLVKTFDIDMGTAKTDITEFIDELVAKGLLTRS